METTMNSSPQSLRNKIALIEAIELSALGFLFWCLATAAALGKPDTNFLDLITFFVILEGILLGSWALYNIFIRIARAGGKFVDVGVWVLATAATGSYTFWAWTILDGNRFLMSKLLYRGDAPVEYAWSARSKQERKAWDKARKEGYI